MMTTPLPPGPLKAPASRRRRFARGTPQEVKASERKRRNREAAQDLRRRKRVYEESLEQTAADLDTDIAALERHRAALAARIAWYEQRLGPAALAPTPPLANMSLAVAVDTAMGMAADEWPEDEGCGSSAASSPPAASELDYDTSDASDLDDPAHHHHRHHRRHFARQQHEHPQEQTGASSTARRRRPDQAMTPMTDTPPPGFTTVTTQHPRQHAAAAQAPATTPQQQQQQQPPHHPRTGGVAPTSLDGVATGLGGLETIEPAVFDENLSQQSISSPSNTQTSSATLLLVAMFIHLTRSSNSSHRRVVGSSSSSSSSSSNSSTGTTTVPSSSSMASTMAPTPAFLTLTRSDISSAARTACTTTSSASTSTCRGRQRWRPPRPARDPTRTADAGADSHGRMTVSPFANSIHDPEYLTSILMSLQSVGQGNPTATGISAMDLDPQQQPQPQPAVAMPGSSIFAF